MEEIYCIGCGAKLQNTDPNEVGYTPKKEISEEQVYCQRCFRLRHYNEIQDVSLTDNDFLALLNTLNKEEALMVNVVDIFDFSGSVIPGLHRFVGDNPVLLVGNKVDLLPKSTNLKKLRNWLMEQAHKEGLRPVEVLLTSSKQKDTIDTLVKTIEKLRLGQDVYVVGTTNVGKSSLINAIIKQQAGLQELITTSRFPGTTLDKIEIPLADGKNIVDTPGIIQRHQMAHLLNPKELKMITPQKEIKPKVYQLQNDQTLFLGGLARFDLETAKKIGVTVYVGNEMTIHRRKTAGSNEFYEEHLGELLTPPLHGNDIPKLVPHSFKITEKSDIVYSGLGFISIKDPCLVTAYAPEGIKVVIRKGII